MTRTNRIERLDEGDEVESPSDDRNIENIRDLVGMSAHVLASRVPISCRQTTGVSVPIDENFPFEPRHLGHPHVHGLTCFFCKCGACRAGATLLPPWTIPVVDGGGSTIPPRRGIEEVD